MEAILSQNAGQLAQYLQTVRYMMVSAMALLVYEYFITLESELKLMWCSRFTYAKLLFFLNRYMPILVGALSIYLNITTSRTDPTYCRRLFFANVSFLVFDATLAISILFLRAYAVWPSVKFIPAFLVTFACAAVTLGVFFLVRYVRDAEVLGQHVTSHGCIITFPDGDLWVSLVTFIACDTVALTLLIAKVVSNSKDAFSTRGILKVIAADGVAYYICSTAITVADVIIFRTVNPNFRSFLILTQISLQNMLCNRLLLHVRAVNAERGEYFRIQYLMRPLGTPSA